MGFLSEKRPKRGWTREELTVAAKTSAPAAASERPRSEIKNGSSAATAPRLGSGKRGPPGAAKAGAPAAASERPRSEIKNGSSAATAPWLRSVKRWPDERTPIALRSTPFFGAALKKPSYSLRPRRCYQSSENLYGPIAHTRPASPRNSRLAPSRIP